MALQNQKEQNFTSKHTLLRFLFVSLPLDLALSLLQDIVGKQKAFAIISRSAKSLGNLLA